MGEIKIDGFLCERCEHLWMSRTNSAGLPRVCPKCKSPYWNRPRREESSVKKEEDFFPPRSKKGKSLID